MSIFNSTGHVVSCHICGKEVYRSRSQLRRSKSGKYFCSKSCSAIYRNSNIWGDLHTNWKDGKASYRNRALKHYGIRCSNPECDLTLKNILIEAYMLDVHHLDGNRNNNDLANLNVLCVWCHALKTRLPS